MYVQTYMRGIYRKENAEWKESSRPDFTMYFKIFILCTGNVPATIGNLTNLTMLSLSYNELEGASCMLRHT